jgi:hypothetical protein
MQFPEYPIRHDTKFWTWIHWYVDVGLSHLVRAQSISFAVSMYSKHSTKNTFMEHHGVSSSSCDIGLFWLHGRDRERSAVH